MRCIVSFEYPAQADGQFQDVQLVHLRRVLLPTRLDGSATSLISLDGLCSKLVVRSLPVLLQLV